MLIFFLLINFITKQQRLYLSIANISSLVKKTDYDTKISETEKKLTDHNHDKYITTPEFNKFTAEIFAARLAQANLVTKTYFDKLISLNKKINSKKTKHLLIENELKKLQTFDSIYFRGFLFYLQKVILKKMVLKII